MPYVTSLSCQLSPSVPRPTASTLGESLASLHRFPTPSSPILHIDLVDYAQKSPRDTGQHIQEMTR